MWWKSRLAAQDVVAFARTTSVRTEMGCFSGGAGVNATQDAVIGFRVRDTSHCALDQIETRLPGQRESMSIDCFSWA